MDQIISEEKKACGRVLPSDRVFTKGDRGLLDMWGSTLYLPYRIRFRQEWCQIFHCSSSFSRLGQINSLETWQGPKTFEASSLLYKPWSLFSFFWTNNPYLYVHHWLKHVQWLKLGKDLANFDAQSFSQSWIYIKGWLERVLSILSGSRNFAIKPAMQ